MDRYNFAPNGLDYDPDFQYGGSSDFNTDRRDSDSRRNNSNRYDNPYEDRDENRRDRQREGSDMANGHRQRRRQSTDSVSRREEISRRDSQRRNRESEAREERARQRERAELQRRDEIAAEKAAERRARDAERAAEKARKAADREAARRERKPFAESGFVKFFTDKRTHAFFGVALICIAVYLLIAAISFMRAGSDDQSAVSSMSVSQIAAGGAKVENSGGPFGAFVAQIVFAQGLGLGSITAIIYLVILGLGLMGIKKCNFWSVTFKSLLVAVAISIVAGFIALWCDSDVLLGGVHGLYVNQFLVANTQWIGAALVSIIVIAAVVFIYLNDFISLYRKYKSLQKAHKEKEEQIRIEREEAQAKVREAMEQSSLDINDVDEEQRAAATERDDNTSESQREALSVGFTDFDNEVTDEYAIDNSNESEQSATTPAQQFEQRQEPILQPELEPEPEQIDDAQVAPMPTVSTTQVPAVSPVAEGVQPEAQGNEGEAGPSFDVVANKIETVDPSHIGAETMYDPTAELSHYQRPGIDLLNDVKPPVENYDILEQQANKERIIKALEQFDIQITKIEATVGPTVTLYEIIPVEGTRIAKIKKLEDDIAMTLSAKGIRIIAPIPGKGTIGIEVPNHDAQTVSIRSILSSKAFQETKCELPMAMGATIFNDVYIADLAAMPHILVAGATGQGKSVGLNTIIASLLYKKHPAELKFVLIDPKRVEFSLYNALERHFLAKLPDEEDAIVTNMDNVVKTLNSLCIEMEKRYDLLKDAKVVKVTKYNELFIQKKLNPEKGHRYLPYIVIIIDEFADLIMTAGKQVETPIARIAQMARAVGMHMIIATQRPSTNVITGLIKANFPGRVAFRVNQMVDSRTILDCPGANQLIGKGDMLFSHNGIMERVQCAYIDTKEVQRICNFIDNQAGFEHPYFLPEPLDDNNETAFGGRNGNLADRDPLFEEAAQIIVQTGVASTSSLQRRYSIGYNRAGKIMDQLEAAGIVGPATGGKARSVLIDSMQLGSIINTND